MGIFRGRNKKDSGTESVSMAEHKKKRRLSPLGRATQARPWILWGGIVCLAASAVLSSFYSVLRTNAKKSARDPIETYENIDWLYQNTFLLYRDLHNHVNQQQADYAGIFLQADEPYKWMTSREIMGNELLWNILCSEEYFEEGEQTQDYAFSQEEIDALKELTEDEFHQIRSEVLEIENNFQILEYTFSGLNSNFDYIIKDHKTGKYVTNMAESELDRLDQDKAFLLSFCFDENGNVSIGDQIYGSDENQIRKYANEIIRKNSFYHMLENNITYFSRYGNLKKPADFTVTYAISRDALENSQAGNFVLRSMRIEDEYYVYEYTEHYIHPANPYIYAGAGGILMLCMTAAFLLGCFLPVLKNTRPYQSEKICALPFEILFFAGCILFSMGGMIIEFIALVAEGTATNALIEYMGTGVDAALFLTGAGNLLLLSLYFFGWWWLGICARAIPGLGLRKYIREKSLIYRFFPFIKSRFIRAWRRIEHMDLTRNAHWAILKIVLINAVVLFLISSLWIGGAALTIVYSVLLYLVLRKYISDLQKKYRILLKAVDEMAEGNLNVTINEDLGVFEPFKPQVIKIQSGFRKVVEEEVKSQRMKAELITNVSHDLKTPLTAIITYVNLLKTENITEEQRREYLDTLERKSMRLKALIEDLFEVSKANSQNITLNIMDIDIMNLIKQVAFEMSDKLKESQLDIRMSLTDERVVLPLDSQKTYRVYENLFGNIAKYAMPGTRVYVNGFRIDDTVVITLKNISAQEITIESSELTERFVRGDSSRNTEGSGLGLAIAKSFTELQGGSLELEVDGDLFKVTTTWRTT